MRPGTAQRLSHPQAMANTITPAMTVTAIAQLLTRTLLTTLTPGLILRDLAITVLVLLVGRAHRRSQLSSLLLPYAA